MCVSVCGGGGGGVEGGLHECIICVFVYHLYVFVCIYIRTYGHIVCVGGCVCTHTHTCMCIAISVYMHEWYTS